ncbi:MAG: cation:proton antiporter [Armatimonadota bacterium]|nr:cation:proton antiporter [Armatimonadota bacterium]
MAKTRLLRLMTLAVVLIAVQRAALGASLNGPVAGHDVGPVLLSLILIIVAAKIGADLAVRIGQPPVLGEIALGLVVGNLALFGFHGFEYIKTDVVINSLAEIGVILLLFEVGLEADLAEMARVGLSSTLVAALGVIAPFGLGFVVARAFLPEHSVYAHVFIGAVLCATSVGITARVFKDLGKLHLLEAKIVLGAAVIDDVMGLLVLAIVQGIISAASGAGALSGWQIALIIGKAAGFLVLAVALGQLLAPAIFRFASRMKAQGLLLAVALAICFLFAYTAGRIGLAPIVGAFAAGLVLDKVHYRDFTDRGEHGLEDLLRPITSFLVPIFFVLMGIRVSLNVFGSWQIIGFAGALTLAAVIGKQICSLGVIGKGLDRFLVGLGMIPRGEVGLIVAAIGARLTLHGEPIIDDKTFSAVVIVVMLTTLLTPPLLRWRMGEGRS